MRIRKKICADLELDKKQLLFDYKQWTGQNEKYSAFNKNLQRQNEKLLRENAALKKQNKELLIYKQKYLQSLNISKPQDSMRINMSFLGLNSGRKQSLRKKEFGDENNQKPLHVPKSARNSYDISSRIQQRMNQTQQRISSRKSSAQRSRRRFNYLEQEQILTQRTDENKERQLRNDENINRYFDNIQLKEQKEQIGRNQNQSNRNPSQQHPQETKQATNAINPQSSNEKSLKQQELIKEIQQLKIIQQQLLKRLQQRGSIIEQLHSLLIVSKVKQGNSFKENDAETIDTALSPNYQH